MSENNAVRTPGRSRPERRLTDLKQWPEIERRLMNGDKTGDVARWVQEELKECLDVQKDSLRRLLAREKERMGVGVSLPEQRSAEEGLNELRNQYDSVKDSELPAVLKKRKYVDVLQEAAELFQMQMERLQMGRSMEKKVSYLIRSMTGDVAEARELLKFCHEVQMELTPTERKRVEDDDVKRFESLGFDARRRVLNALESFKSRMKEIEKQERIVDAAAEDVVVEAVDEGQKDYDQSVQIVSTVTVTDQNEQKEGLPFD